MADTSTPNQTSSARVLPLTVGEALRLPAIRRGRPHVLCGHERLQQWVRWVHVAEVTNIAELLRGGELLLTTGQALASPPSFQQTFIESLARRGIAAVVLELGQHVAEPPAAAVKAARRAELPFVVLRREVRFVDVTEELHRRLIDRQLFILTRADQLDRALTRLVAAGEGIPALVEVLAESIGAAVVLRGAHDEVLHETEPAVGQTGDASPFSIEIPGDSTAAGRLVVNWHGRGTGPGAYERLATERAASVVALLMARADHERLLTLRERGGFLTELSGGTLASDEAERRATRLGFAASDHRLLPLAVTLEGGIYSELAERADALPALARDLHTEIEAKAQRVLLGVRAYTHRLFGLVTMPRGRERADVAEWVAAAVHRATRRRFGPDAEAVVVIGEATASIAAAAEPLRATLDAATSASDATQRLWHDATTADLERLLLSLRTDERVRRFVERRLHRVLEHDAESASPLLPTLVALTDHRGNRSGTARTLGIRRQSLYRRIERLERLLDGSLDDPDVLLEVRLALRAQRVIS